MTRNDIRWLATDEARALIEANLAKSPTAVALDKHLPNAALVAEQVKELQRARAKLPAWYDARCILPARAFEQSTSEAVAATKHYAGELCVDLTCGLGVDTAHFSRSFRRVVAVERDEVLADVARENFSRLGITNVEVVCASAEDFTADFAGRADLIYADPDRRNSTGRRFANPAECSPNMLKLMPKLLSISELTVVKNSPLFDVDEAFRLFGDACRRVEVISSDGECREILVECSHRTGERTIAATACGSDSYELPYTQAHPPVVPFAPPYLYITVPDAALRAAHITTDWATALDPSAYATVNGYLFANMLINSPLCRTYPITAMLPYNPRTMRRLLAERGITRACIHLADINTRVADVCRELKICEGGTAHLFLTTVGATKWCIVSQQ